ncbi:MAG: hypothetical protein AAFX02_10565 [Pseudomonadota bacterium]
MSGDKDQPETDAEFTEITDNPDENAESVDETMDQAPIDARYVEPEQSSPNGPGWIGVALVGVAAAIGGAVFGNLGGASSPGTLNSDVAERSAENEAGLSTAKQDLEALSAELAALGSRVNEVAQSETNSDGIEPLLDRISALEGALETGANSDGTGLGDLVARVETLEKADEEAGNLNPRLLNRQVITMGDEVEQLREENAALTASVESSAATITSLQSRIETLESALQNTQSALNATEQGQATTAAQAEASQNAVDAAIAYSIIESAASRGEPFSLAVQRLTPESPNDPVVAKLRAIAPQGAPTLAMLQTEFDALSTELSGTGPGEAQPKKDNGWGWVRKTLADNVTIDTEESKTVSANLIKASALLDAGDVRGAINQLQTLPEAQRQQANDWIASANRRLELDTALTALRLRMISAN